MPIIHPIERDLIPIIQSLFLTPSIINSNENLNVLETVLGDEAALYIARIAFLETQAFGWRSQYNTQYGPGISLLHHCNAMGSNIGSELRLFNAYLGMCRYMIHFANSDTPLYGINHVSLVQSINSYAMHNFDTRLSSSTLDIRLIFGPIRTMPSDPVVETPTGSRILDSMRGFTIEAREERDNDTLSGAMERFENARRENRDDIATVRDGLPSLRPTSHSANDIAHNLNIMYRGCFGMLGGNLFIAREFSSGSNKAVDIHFYNEGTDKITKQPFDPNLHKFVDLDYGWVQAKNRLVYLETVIGGYVRGVSDSNVQCGISIVDNSIFSGERVKYDMVMGLLSRKFMDIETGLRNSSEGIIISREVALFLAKDKSKKHSKYFLMYSDMCVGELSKNTRFIKVYAPYKECIPALTKVMPYDLR